MAITKPDMQNIWAEAGAISVPPSADISEGWVVEKPPFEEANFVENRQDNGIAYLFQEGIAEWDNLTEYQLNSLVKYNGVVYKSSGTNTNKQPNIFPLNWSIAFENFGAAQAVQDIVDEITGTDGYVDFYVQKSDPTLENPLSAPKVSADTGMANGHKFQSTTDPVAAKSGVVYNSGNVELVINEVVKGRITPTMSINSNDETLVTTAMLRSFILDYAFPVGSIHITEESYNPASRFGGSWIRVAEGQAIVGRNDGVTSDIPDWVKTAGNTFGEYEHTLTTNELPNFRLGQNAHSDVLATPAEPVPHVIFDVAGDFDGLAQGTDPVLYTNKERVYTDPIGNDEPFNIVQPSVVYNIWKRIG